MAATVMQYPTSINHEKFCLEMGGDGKPVSLRNEGKVVPLHTVSIDPVNTADPHVQFVGAWAVAEHNRNTGQGLEFVKVSGGWVLVISKTKQVDFLNLVAKDKNGVARNYLAIVWGDAQSKTPYVLLPYGKLILKH